MKEDILFVLVLDGEVLGTHGPQMPGKDGRDLGDWDLAMTRVWLIDHVILGTVWGIRHV